MAEVILNKDTFEAEVLKSDVPVLVDFWAPWCGPCRFQGPIVEELAREYEGKPVKIAKLNVDEAREIIQGLNILSIPTLIIFKNGQPLEPMIGVQEKETLQAKLNEAMA